MESELSTFDTARKIDPDERDDDENRLSLATNPYSFTTHRNEQTATTASAFHGDDWEWSTSSTAGETFTLTPKDDEDEDDGPTTLSDITPDDE